MSGLFAEFDLYDATGLGALVRSRQVSPDELLTTSLAIAARVDPKIRALCHVDEAAARAIIQAGVPDGPFQGVPFLLKDITAVATGFRASLGSRFFADQLQHSDTELVARMRRSGLVFFGRTTTPELAFSPTTEAVVYGAPTRNPWDLSRSPGGSSGGSGAAVAAGIVPMAHGSDGGGSIRQPAAANGLVGLKPTRGRLPVGPFVGEGWGGLLAECVLSRSVRDTAAFLDSTHGPDLGAPYYAPLPPTSYTAAASLPPARLRIALLTHRVDGQDVTPEVEAATRSAGSLCAGLGHHVEEASPAFDYWEMQKAFVAVVCCGTAMSIDDRARALGRQPKDDELEPTLWSAYEVGKQISGTDYLAALSVLHRLSRQIAPFFEKYDVLVTPVFSRLTAPLGEFAHTLRDAIEYRVGRVANYAAFAVMSNMTGQPAISLPLNWSEGQPSIPIGTQFVGRYGEDHVLLALAAELEQARPWFHKRPPLVAESRLAAGATD